MAEGTVTQEQGGALVAAPEKRAAAPVAFGQGKGLVPTDLEGLWRVAQYVSRSGLAPKGIQSPEAILVAAAMGAEIGLSFMQSLQNIAVINGRPSVWGDAALALVRASGLCASYREWVDGEGDRMAAHAKGQRVGDEAPTEEVFGVEDAKRAGLWNKEGPWRQYPKRMLAMRARGFLLRNLWPDVLRGTITAEEAQDYPTFAPTGPGTPFDILESPTAAPVQPAPSMPEASVQPAEVVEPPPAEPPAAKRGRHPKGCACEKCAAKAAPTATPLPTEAQSHGTPVYAIGEAVETPYGPAVVLDVQTEPHPERGWQYQVRRDKDDGQHAGAEFWQYESSLSSGIPAEAETVAAPAQAPTEPNGGTSFLFCKRDQHRVNALVCSQKCDVRDDCPEFLAFQKAHAAPAAPAGLFG